MDKQFYDKYGKEFHCATCQQLTTCVNRPEPLIPNCCEQYLRDRIAELEEQLKNAIVPKFKIGQEVWFIYDKNDDGNYTILNKKVMAFSFSNYGVNYFEFAMSDDGTGNTIWYGYIDSKYVFATKEEAQAKLEELKGENKC